MTNQMKSRTGTSSATLEKGKQQIQSLYQTLFESSSIKDRSSSDDYFPKFELHELKLGKVLGKGGFGTVSEIKSISLNGVAPKADPRPLYSPEEEEEEYDHSTKTHRDKHETKLFQSAARLFLARHCIRPKKKKKNSLTISTSTGDARYAIKQLSPEVLQDPKTCLQGMMDLAIETRFLCALQHPHIVKCRGLSKLDPLKREDYFIVLDRLYQTLETKIESSWKTRHSFGTSSVGKFVAPTHSAKLWEKRLVYAFDLSAALAYLHNQRILYRDLKPENIGFDCRGDIKLFDFGLCREVKDSDRVNSTSNSSSEGVELYKLTAETGSPRYMAPEVALGQPYNSTCDTYSFCMVFWQMLALQPPFELYNMTKMKLRVWGNEQKRPLVKPEWPKSIQGLFQRGWTPIVAERLTMDQVEDLLRDECLRTLDDESRLEHERRRSSTHFENHHGKENSSHSNNQQSKTIRTGGYTAEELGVDLTDSNADLLLASDEDSESDDEEDDTEENNPAVPEVDNTSVEKEEAVPGVQDEESEMMDYSMNEYGDPIHKGDNSDSERDLYVDDSAEPSQSYHTAQDATEAVTTRPRKPSVASSTASTPECMLCGGQLGSCPHYFL